MEVSDRIFVLNQSYMKLPLNTLVCIVDAEIYLDYNKRLKFNGWLKDNVLISTNKCIMLNETDVYTPNFRTEYLVVVTSEPKLFSYSYWIGEDEYFVFNAPKTINGTDVLFKFREWNMAENPLDNKLTTVVTKPLTLIAYYDKYFPIRIIVNNTSKLIGWFKEGSTYYYVPSQTPITNVKKALSIFLKT